MPQRSCFDRYEPRQQSVRLQDITLRDLSVASIPPVPVTHWRAVATYCAGPRTAQCRFSCGGLTRRTGRSPAMAVQKCKYGRLSVAKIPASAAGPCGGGEPARMHRAC